MFLISSCSASRKCNYLKTFFPLQGSQSYNLDPKTCHVRTSEGVGITNFRVLQTLANLGTSQIILFGRRSSFDPPSSPFCVEKIGIASTSTYSSIQPCPSADERRDGCSAGTHDNNEIARESTDDDEPRPGCSKDVVNRKDDSLEETATSSTTSDADGEPKQVFFWGNILQMTC